MFRVFSSRKQCVDALAGQLAACLEGSAPRTLLLPGGSTPAPLFEQLAGMALDWSSLLISPTDERWVAADAAASNLRLLRESLPQAGTLDPRQGDEPGAAAAGWGAQLVARLPLTAVLLGMGEDGHFASLFPGMPGLTEGLDPQAPPCCLPGFAPQQPVQRLSASLSLLLASDWIGLLVFGEAKRQLLQQVLADPAASVLPIARLLEAAPQLEIYWAP